MYKKIVSFSRDVSKALSIFQVTKKRKDFLGVDDSSVWKSIGTGLWTITGCQNVKELVARNGGVPVERNGKSRGIEEQLEDESKSVMLVRSHKSQSLLGTVRRSQWFISIWRDESYFENETVHFQPRDPSTREFTQRSTHTTTRNRRNDETRIRSWLAYE